MRVSLGQETKHVRVCLSFSRENTISANPLERFLASLAWLRDLFDWIKKTEADVPYVHSMFSSRYGPRRLLLIVVAHLLHTLGQ